MQKFKVAAVNYSDAFELQRNQFGALEGVGGIEYEVLRILAQGLKLKFELFMPKDDTWGLKTDDNNWTGILGMLQRNEVDFAIASLAISRDRMEIVDFSFPYSFDRITFATLNPAYKSKEFVYLYPFQISVWMGFLSSLLVFFIALCIIHHRMKLGKWWKSVSLAIDIIFCMKSYKYLPCTLSYRAFCGIFNLSVLIVRLSYTCIFLSFILAPQMEDKINSFADLIQTSQKCKLKITVPKDMGQWILTSTDNVTKELSKELLKQKDAFLSRDKDPIKYINEGYAVISASSIHHFKLYQSGEIRRAYISSATLRPKYDAIAFRKNFSGIKRFDQMILRMLQAGLYEKVIQDYFHRWLYYAKRRKSDTKIRRINLDDVVGAFSIILPFYSLSVFAYFIEVHWWKKTKKKRKANLRKQRKLRKSN